MDTGNRKWLIVISIPAIICILLIIFFSACEPSTNMPLWGRGAGSRTVPSYILWISLVLMIIVIIPISYYFLSARLDEKLEKNMKIISKLINKGDSISKTKSKEITEKNVILKFLNESEKKVLEKLIENRGTVLQSEISRMEGMTTLKTHRCVKDLERKGIIKTETHGKTNRIILTKDIKDILLK